MKNSIRIELLSIFFQLFINSIHRKVKKKIDSFYGVCLRFDFICNQFIGNVFLARTWCERMMSLLTTWRVPDIRLVVPPTYGNDHIDSLDF